MGSHMNKMRGGFGRDQVSLEGPFARGIAGAVSGWANQAKSHKVEVETYSMSRVSSTQGWAAEQAGGEAGDVVQALHHHLAAHARVRPVLRLQVAVRRRGHWCPQGGSQTDDQQYLIVMLTAQMILAARSPFFVELMMKNPQHCVITNIDMETLKLLVTMTLQW